MGIVRFENVHKSYPLGKTMVHALTDISLEVSEGEFVTIAGPSGSGKSTLLNLFGLIDVPSEGSVFVDGKQVNFRNDRELTGIRKKTVGFIFQSFNLIPILTVYENIEFPIRNSPLSRSEKRKRVLEIVEAVGLSGLEKRMPDRISGGQQQRVAIGRAIAAKPRIIVADEPTANLDSATGKTIVGLLHGINRTNGTTVLLATHDREIIGISDRVLSIHDGRLQE